MNQLANFLFFIISFVFLTVNGEAIDLTKLSNTRFIVEDISFGKVLTAQNESDIIESSLFEQVYLSALILKSYPYGYKFKTQIFRSDDNLCLDAQGDPSLDSERLWYLANEFRRNNLAKLTGTFNFRLPSLSKIDYFGFVSKQLKSRLEETGTRVIGEMKNAPSCPPGAVLAKSESVQIPLLLRRYLNENDTDRLWTILKSAPQIPSSFQKDFLNIETHHLKLNLKSLAGNISETLRDLRFQPEFLSILNNRGLDAPTERGFFSNNGGATSSLIFISKKRQKILFLFQSEHKIELSEIRRFAETF